MIDEKKLPPGVSHIRDAIREYMEAMKPRVEAPPEDGAEDHIEPPRAAEKGATDGDDKDGA